MGTILCFTLRDQSYISKVSDPEKAFNMLFLGRVRVHGKKAESDPFPGGMPTLDAWYSEHGHAWYRKYGHACYREQGHVWSCLVQGPAGYR